MTRNKMKILTKGTNLELTEALKNYVEEKVGVLDRYMDGILEARVELEKTTPQQKGEIFRCEVNLSVPQTHLLRAESTEIDLYAAIDTVIPKLREEIQKYKGQHFSKDRRMRRYMKSIFAWPWWKKRS